MKENNGKRARQDFSRKLCMILFVFSCSIGFLYFVDKGLADDNSGSMVGGRGGNSLWKRLKRKRNKKLTKREAISAGINSIYSTGKVNNNVGGGYDDDDDKFKQILAADLNLIDIEINKNLLMGASSDTYDGVYGIFCILDFAVHKEDPSSVPMFRDLVGKSRKCQSTRKRVPLKDIATQARAIDEKNRRQPTDRQVPKPLNLTALVFHESRCGSTLVANTLIGMNPEQHRVYSESPPPVTAMKACGDDYEKCSLNQAAMILRDVLYMMGRTNDPKEERVFFKIQSVGSRHIDVFRHAFPTTPWLFVFRDPVQVMMSHLANGLKRANCMRSARNPPFITQQIAKRRGHSSASDLSPEEFCAAHLASITETALQNVEQSNHYGMPVNYASLPASMYERIVPNHLGVKTTQREIDNIIQVSSQYSKGRGEKKMEWQEDSVKKEEGASPEIRNAAKSFMFESYEKLEQFARLQ